MPPMTLTGVYAPVPTPFNHDDQVDIARIRTSFARWLTTRLTGFVVLGTNGEAGLLDDEESDLVIETVRALVPRERTLIAGTGRESTQATIRACKRAAQLGADAVLVRTPSFFKSRMTDAALIHHYTAVADGSTAPVLLYNFSTATGVNLSPAAVQTLSEHPNIVGMKESGSDIAHIADLVAMTPVDFPILAGSATTFYAALCAGVSGGILALAALLPEPCVRLFELARADSATPRDEARALQRKLLPIARMISAQYGVAGLKAALALTGIDVGIPRPPLMLPDRSAIHAMRDALSTFEEVTV
jgi:4-hydroxy-2-oxoglutarate aldolase